MGTISVKRRNAGQRVVFHVWRGPRPPIGSTEHRCACSEGISDEVCDSSTPKLVHC